MENQPLVSIITPSFNQAAYIQATMDSVLSQSYLNIEYLIIDGGSTDGTVEILKNCRDPRLKWVSEKDHGQTDAINKGLRWSQGEIIAYLNSDDLFLPGAISVSVDAFEQNPDADLVYGDCILIDSKGEQIGDVGYGKPFDLLRVLSGRVSMPQQTMFWRKRATDKIGLFDDKLHYVMDVDYWLRMVAVGLKPLYVSGVRGGYRLHNDSKTISQVEGFWKDWDKMIEKFFSLPNLSSEITQIQPKIKKTYWWLYTLRSPWVHGYRAELRPMLKQVIRGSVPLTHRILAALMYIDTYLHTSFGDTLLNLTRRGKSIAKLRP